MRRTIEQLLARATEQLTDVSDSPALDAEVLLAAALQTSRTTLFTHRQRHLPGAARRLFQQLIDQRAAGTPVAYLTGHQEFFGLTLMQNRSALIARPATELIVETLLNELPLDHHGPVVDVGTGSGAIALALANARPRLAVLATDPSIEALRLAAANSRRLRLDQHIDWRRGSLLGPVELEQLDAIIANLPYLTPDQMSHPSIQAEPVEALRGGGHGLAFVRALIEQASHRGDWQWLALEFDPAQAGAVGRLTATTWPNATIRPITDGQSTRGLLVTRD